MIIIITRWVGEGTQDRAQTMTNEPKCTQVCDTTTPTALEEERDVTESSQPTLGVEDKRTARRQHTLTSHRNTSRFSNGLPDILRLNKQAATLHGGRARGLPSKKQVKISNRAGQG